VQSAGRLAKLTGVQIAATGSYVPDQVVPNEALESLGCDADWIVQRTGIQERRRAAADQATSDLAYEAARTCLAQAGVSPREVDMVIVATMTPDMPSPSAACLLQQRLGAPAPAMDINAACAGFLYGLITGMQFVHSGCHRRVLVVGADVMTRIMDPQDKKTYPLFGDGAGAVLLAPGSDSQGLLGYCLGADGGGADLLCVRGGGSRMPVSSESLAARHHFLRMEGRAVFKWAVRTISESTSEVLSHAALTVDDVDIAIWHQANLRIIDAATSNLRLPREKVVVNVERYGNTAGGSVPLALDEVHRDGLLSSGDRVLLSGFGAGLAWGTALLAW
jgi:3-oxoacyl-[acyl-carrier-protein] synthase-3